MKRGRRRLQAIFRNLRQGEAAVVKVRGVSRGARKCESHRKGEIGRSCKGNSCLTGQRTHNKRRAWEIYFDETQSSVKVKRGNLADTCRAQRPLALDDVACMGARRTRHINREENRKGLFVLVQRPPEHSCSSNTRTSSVREFERKSLSVFGGKEKSEKHANKQAQQRV
ncbi:hypothetical protein TRVL_02015 [Trypanosoma vivax]|nr:hypothetical protein TRVL_02015 [Trypanosoma vivax]